MRGATSPGGALTWPRCSRGCGRRRRPSGRGCGPRPWPGWASASAWTTWSTPTRTPSGPPPPRAGAGASGWPPGGAGERPPPAAGGGAERRAVRLGPGAAGRLPELADAFSVVLAVPAAGPAADRADALGVSVVQVPDHVLRRRHLGARALGPWLARVRPAGSQQHQLHRRDPFALVYGNTLAVPLAGLLARRWRVPGVLHVHECPEPRWLARALLQAARATATAVVCNSAYSRGFVVELVPALASRAVVVHNGLDLPPAPPPPEPSP